ncbi:MAG: hypothetical protein LUH82_02720 [Clostridiales bacterium]|nr:hypothetical protein [Clostridiales bacterium]
MQDNSNDILYRLSRFAFISSIIGVCTIGICPAFGVIGIVVPAVINAKMKDCPAEIKELGKKSAVAGVIALFMFVIDIIIAVIVIK